MNRPAARLLAAILSGLALVGLTLLPGYRERVVPGYTQVQRLPHRAGRSLEEIRISLRPGHRFVTAARDLSFDDAVIWISDDPRDETLASLLHCAYYLYPRVLVQTATVESTPDLEVDFVLCTPNFAPVVPDSLKGQVVGLIALSQRGRRHATETWP